MRNHKPFFVASSLLLRIGNGKYVMKKKKYEIFMGNPSWHQKRAGHSFASSIVINLTEDKLKKRVENWKMKNPHEPIYWKEIK